MKRNNYWKTILTLAIFALTATQANAQAQYRKATDFDGDGKADATVIRRDNQTGAATWYTQNSADNSYTATQWGLNGESARATGDFDGDGRGDIAVVRRNETATNYVWYIRRSQTNTFYTVVFGLSSDAAMAADFDGDGKTDVAVVRQNNSGSTLASYTWYYLSSQTGQTVSRNVPVALSGAGVSCVPMNGDYNGDGLADFAHRCAPAGGNLTWDIVYSSTGEHRQFQWGLRGDLVVAGDYDGDGKTDAAVIRQVQNGLSFRYDWYALQSSDQSVLAQSYGGRVTNSWIDVPVQADYDGDGKTDLAVSRLDAFSSPDVGAIYYIQQSSTGAMRGFQWGVSNDVTMFYGVSNVGLTNANP